jgi:hypothetical protein
MERGEELYTRWGWLAVFVTPAIVSGTAKMRPYRFAFWNLMDSLGWSVSVAASAYGVGRLATGHHDAHPSSPPVRHRAHEHGSHDELRHAGGPYQRKWRTTMSPISQTPIADG